MDEEDDATRIVARRAPGTGDEVDDENTRVVNRGPQERPGDADDDHTRVVAHRGVEDDDDSTRVVTRNGGEGHGDDDDHTRVVTRPSSEDDGDDTRVVQRAPKQHSLTLPGSGRRRGITMPPAMENYSPEVEIARGPGAVEPYPTRDIPEPPPPPPPIQEGPSATRMPAPSMPSVGRHSRRSARVALTVFVTSCVLAVAAVVTGLVILL